MSDKRSAKKRKHPWAFPLGLAVIALAVVGAVTLISSGIKGVKKLTDDTEQKIKYESFLAPVVMNDPDPFDDISKAKMTQLLDSAVWALLNDDIKPDEYEYADGDILVPQGDVEVQFKKLFGNEVKPVHTSISDSSYGFAYDQSRKLYIIPLTGVIPLYYPKVYTIDKKGDSIVLTVGYVGTDKLDQNKQGEIVWPAPDKFMKITLRDSGESYYIGAIQATDPPEAVGHTQKQPDITTTRKQIETTETPGETGPSETLEETNSAKPDAMEDE